jgi:hypothetical protein
MKINNAGENQLVVQGDVEHTKNADRKQEMPKNKKYCVVGTKRTTSSSVPSSLKKPQVHSESQQD